MVRVGVRPVSFCLVRLAPGSTIEIEKKKKEKRKTERAGLLTKGGGSVEVVENPKLWEDWEGV